jgi:prepilin-type N-terminal cleavage/methylation domain-containing protein
MSHTFKKISLRGFTLIELLVVIAIIGLLSTVIAAPITQARKKGRDGKKVADLHQIQGALQQYADDHVGNYPGTIAALSPIYLANVPPFASSSAAVKDKYMYTAYVSDTSSTTIGFHLGTKLEAASLALGDDRDCYGSGSVSPSASFCIEKTADSSGLVSGVPGNYTGVALGTTPSNFASDENILGVAGFETPAPTVQFDFGGGSDTADAAVTPCSAVTYQKSPTTNKPACIYDITN